MLGLSGKVPECLRPYMEQRSQIMYVHCILSDVRFLLPYVPESSVHGRLVFIKHFRSLEINGPRYGVKYRCISMTDNCIYHWILTMS